MVSPSSVNTAVTASEMYIMVETQRLSPLMSPAPKRWDTSIVMPCMKPVIRPNSSQVSQSVLPIAPSASAPAN